MLKNKFYNYFSFVILFTSLSCSKTEGSTVIFYNYLLNNDSEINADFRYYTTEIKKEFKSINFIDITELSKTNYLKNNYSIKEILEISNDSLGFIILENGFFVSHGGVFSKIDFVETIKYFDRDKQLLDTPLP